MPSTAPVVRLASFAVAVSLLFPAATHGQQAPHPSREGRAIKGLSDEEFRGLRAGEGMGLALAAELNGYPGPRHVLELADSLGLTPERRQAIQGIFDRMRAQAVRLGDALVGLEASLDSTFAERRVTAMDLQRRLARLAALRGELRYVHLAAHLEVTALLAPEEVKAYQRLRGYGTGEALERRHGAAPSPPR